MHNLKFFRKGVMRCCDKIGEGLVLIKEGDALVSPFQSSTELCQGTHQVLQNDVLEQERVGSSLQVDVCDAFNSH